MRKTVLGALISGALLASSAANAGLVFDLNGSAAGGLIVADSLDWAPTSFLAMGGNAAIANFASGACATSPALCQFDVLTHSKLTGYTQSGTGAALGIPAGFGEITMVARYTEQVVAASAGPVPSATFVSTGAGWMEFYWSAAADANALTGANYNNGTLIGRLDGVTQGAFGTFTVTGGARTLDQSSNGDQYAGQQTVRGTGSQDNLDAGLTGVQLDPSFFVTSLAAFTIQYNNISIGLPFGSVDPSDCFNIAPSGAAVGTAGLSTQCLDNHVAAQMAGQGADGGYAPNVGLVNGLGLGAPDFIAQTDYNSSVTGVPEPGSLALVGLALAGAGFAAKRRKAV